MIKSLRAIQRRMNVATEIYLDALNEYESKRNRNAVELCQNALRILGECSTPAMQTLADTIASLRMSAE